MTSGGGGVVAAAPVGVSADDWLMERFAFLRARRSARRASESLFAAMVQRRARKGGARARANAAPVGRAAAGAASSRLAARAAQETMRQSNERASSERELVLSPKIMRLLGYRNIE